MNKPRRRRRRVLSLHQSNTHGLHPRRQREEEQRVQEKKGKERKRMYEKLSDVVRSRQ